MDKKENQIILDKSKNIDPLPSIGFRTADTLKTYINQGLSKALQYIL
jgi:hypothetical protein